MTIDKLRDNFRRIIGVDKETDIEKPRYRYIDWLEGYILENLKMYNSDPYDH